MTHYRATNEASEKGPAPSKPFPRLTHAGSELFLPRPKWRQPLEARRALSSWSRVPQKASPTYTSENYLLMIARIM